ncbi:MAG: Pr6Pr family membrane protein [Leifsonia sp.]
MRVREKTTHPAQGRVLIGLGWLRIGLAAGEVIALIGNLQYVLGFSAFGVGNFFGYFTIQSAIIAVPVLIIGGILLLGRRRETRAFITIRTIVLVYVLLSGIVFGLLAAFSTTRTYQIAIPWSDQLLHFVLPVGILIDWLVHRFLAPLSPAVPWIALGWSVPFPILWLVLTVIRGEAVGWYPYFFLDPSQVSGTPAIVGYCAVVLLTLLGFTAAFIGLSRLRRLD